MSFQIIDFLNCGHQTIPVIVNTQIQIDVKTYNIAKLHWFNLWIVLRFWCQTLESVTLSEQLFLNTPILEPIK